jgi:flagellar biosynthesis component FlhA
MSLPAIPVEIQFGSALAVLANVDQPPARQLQIVIEAQLQGLVDDLGIPGNVQVGFSVSKGDPLRVLVCGSTAPYSADLARTVWESVVPALTADLGSEFSIAAWSSRNLPAVPLPGEPERWRPAAEFLSRLAIEIVKQRPERLFQHEHAVAYLDRARTSGAIPDPPKEQSPIDAGKLLDVARELLKLKLAIRDREAILGQIREGASLGLGFELMVEELVDRLRPGSVIVDMHPAGIRRLLDRELQDGETAAASEVARFAQPLTLLSEGLFYELGIRVPPVVFRASQALSEAGFAVTVNHVPGIARRGLADGQVLVNETPERLALVKISGLPARNPANGNACAVIAAKDAGPAKELRLTVWSPLEYVVLGLSAEIRRNAPRLLDSEAVEAELSQLRDVFPALVLAAMDTLSPAALTRVLRGLLWEEVSIRNLRTILERVTNYDYAFADTSRRIVFDDRLAIDERLQAGSTQAPGRYVEFIRQGMKSYIGHKLTRGTGNLTAFLLSPELESAVLADVAARCGDAEAQPLTAEQMDQLRGAIGVELRLPAGNLAILTFAGIRSTVRRLIEDQFPKLAVLAYEELPPDLKIQPVARISLPEKRPISRLASGGQSV